MELVKTSRYVRVAMLLLVLGLAVAVASEVRAAERSCWRGSISAYFYTPAGRMFTAALVATGVCLVCLRSRIDVEDILLNVAGMCAPIVGLVPTTDGDSCRASRGYTSTPATKGAISPEISTSVTALIAIAVVGVLFLGFVSYEDDDGDLAFGAWLKQRVVHPGWPVVGVLVAVAVIAGFAVIGRNVTWVNDGTVHQLAACLMFACLAGVAALNAWGVKQDGTSPAKQIARHVYPVLAVVMTVTLLVALVLTLTSSGGDHWVLVVEIIEIGSFALLWIVQTADLWDEGVRQEIPASPKLGAVVRSLLPGSPP